MSPFEKEIAKTEEKITPMEIRVRIKESFKGKAKSAARALFLGGLLTAGAGSFDVSQAEAGIEAVEGETLEKKALKTIETLYNIPDDANAADDTDNESLRYRKAHRIIEGFIIEVSCKGVERKCSPSLNDFKRGLFILENADAEFVRREVIKKYGEATKPTIEKFERENWRNIGVQALDKIWEEIFSMPSDEKNETII